MREGPGGCRWPGPHSLPVTEESEGFGAHAGPTRHSL